MNTDLQQIESIFLEAIERTGEERARYVAQACGQDELLRENVETLLKSHIKNDDGFLLNPPVPNITDALSQVEDAEELGELIGGRYRLLEQIGEGGMGVVYMAEQTEGVRRRVAIKVIKLGMDTRQFVARFEAERQAMALLDHPGIASVFDAGSTPTGRPYLVMELVRGSNITQFVDDHKFSLEKKLKLFVDVCNAIQHAHHKGIIHRDIKPSNILVTPLGGVPTPKVIDFGIAKAIDYQLTDKTLFTRYAALVGTPQYMSPEQAGIDGLDVDTRSDVYSLGVLLYQLITGSTPLSANKLEDLHPLSLPDTLRNADIDTPSTRLSKNRGNLVEDASKELALTGFRNELDWIVMKAIAYDRDRRYTTASELAKDVRHYLDGEPVAAAPTTRRYKAGLFLRKYRKTVFASLSVMLLLATATIISLYFALDARRANTKLTDTVFKLNNNIKKLETTETNLRNQIEQQLYDSAHLATFDEFALAIQPELAVFAHRVNKEWLEEFKKSEAAKKASGVEFAVELGAPELLIHLRYDSSVLTKFQHAELLGDALTRITAAMEKSAERNRTARSDKLIERTHQRLSSKRALDVTRELNAIIKSHRRTQYEILVKYYRQTFGENNYRVADALDLLAAVLIEEEEYSEAESHLKESLLLTAKCETDNDELKSKIAAATTRTQALLKICRDKQARN